MGASIRYIAKISSRAFGSSLTRPAIFGLDGMGKGGGARPPGAARRGGAPGPPGPQPILGREGGDVGLPHAGVAADPVGEDEREAPAVLLVEKIYPVVCRGVGHGA